jgi:GNAT superfamily N-acetyltransferase
MKRVITGFEVACEMERIDALHLAQQVGAYRQLVPSSGAELKPLFGGMAAFTDISFGRKLNHVAGAAMSGPVNEETIGDIASYYAERGLRTEIDLCPHADARVLDALRVHGFSVSAFSNSYAINLSEGSPSAACGTGLVVSKVGGHDQAEWIKTSIAGFSHQIDSRPANLIETLAQIAAFRDDTMLFIARANGEPVGTAGMSVFDTSIGKAAHLYIASTMPSYRKRGVQLALSEARLVAAREMGCTIATLSARPYNGSARNAERAGFTLAYTKSTFVSNSQV